MRGATTLEDNHGACPPAKSSTAVPSTTAQKPLATPAASAAEAAEARAWAVLLHLSSIHSHAGASSSLPSAAELMRVVAEADEVLKVAPPTDFAVVSVATHALSQSRVDPSRTRRRPSSQVEKGSATAAATIRELGCLPALAPHKSYGPPPPVGTIISLASCLELPERGTESLRASRNGLQQHSLAAPAVLSPRTASTMAADILKRYQHVFDAATGQTGRAPSNRHKEETNKGADDSSGTGGSANLAEAREAPGASDATVAAIEATNIFERYRDIIDLSGGLHGSAAGTGDCKSRGSGRDNRHPPIDAGSGGTADVLAAEQGSPADHAPLLDSTAAAVAVGGGSSGGTCGDKGGSDEEDRCSTPVTAAKLELRTMPAAAPPASEVGVGVPWTFSYFFDDEEL